METTPPARRTALYRLYDIRKVLLYVGIGYHFGVRWEAHARQQPWWAEVDHQTVQWYPSREEAREAELTAIREEKPLHNVADSPWAQDDSTGFPVKRQPKARVAYTAVSVTRPARDALQELAVIGTSVTQRRVSMSEAIRAAQVLCRRNPEEFQVAVARAINIENEED